MDFWKAIPAKKIPFIANDLAPFVSTENSVEARGVFSIYPFHNLLLKAKFSSNRLENG